MGASILSSKAKVFPGKAASLIKRAVPASVLMALTLAMAVNVTLVSTPVEAKPKTNLEKGGRTGNWRTGAQDAPSVEACREAVKAKPDSAIAHNDLGWALRQNNNAKEAEVELRAAVTLDDKLHQAHSNLSVCLLDLGKTQEAVEEARKAVGLKQDQPIYHVVLGNAL
ncbi:MAG TPA: tetratricopeptide repeat protein, partial [Candidatus Obscuribacter sp.]|nr:tetratricopeptide repeat protein [Candidatus Obscuribacter sp.]